MKNFYIQYNVGKTKYCVSFHDGIKRNNDGSPFYDIRIFRSKIKLIQFVYSLERDGYNRI